MLGTHYDAGDVDNEYYTVKVFDATGWPSVPGCIEDPDCEQNNQTIYKGSATNPTTVILGAPILSLDTSNQYGFAARQYLTAAVAKGIIEQIDEQPPEPPQPNEIPTLSEWGMIIFMTIIMGLGVVTLFRRRI
jgi:hypothetical protein